MFEESLVESTPLLRNRWPALLSFTTQAAMVVALIALPMFHPEILSLRSPSLSFIAPPPHPPQPPPVRLHVANSTSSTSMPPTSAAPMSAPHQLPNPSATAEAPNLNPIGIMPGADTTPFASMVSIAPAVRVVPASAIPGKPADRVTLSTGVSAGLLLTPIQPVYPPIARAAHVGGTVIIQAVISKSGRIESAHVLSGPVMLQSAALDALRNARYRPYLLNNQPTEVETTFSINFVLGS